MVERHVEWMMFSFYRGQNLDPCIQMKREEIKYKGSPQLEFIIKKTVLKAKDQDRRNIMSLATRETQK